jgi:hypothetical protein
VRDDLVLAVEALDTVAAGDELLDALLARATELFARDVTALAPHAEFRWLLTDNRPALRLLAHRLFRIEQTSGFSADYIAAAERLLALNPNDNHGIRAPLCTALVERREWHKVLALTDRYPQDFPQLFLNRLLALLRVGRVDDAQALLRTQGTNYRTAIEMLLPKNQRRPRTAPAARFGITLEELAFNYRERARALWEDGGALDWLCKAARAMQ